ncbi:GNAT family N-acetyltransferase, partial [bacterium]|nr:GNAT family N-acetyltransferase [bacterium]
MNGPLKVRELRTGDLPWVERAVTEHFGSPRVVSRGRLHEVQAMPGFVADADGDRLGVLQYRQAGGDFEIVILISVVRRRGIGRSLVAAAQAMAQDSGCDRLWLVTTNDNQAARAFYEALGWRQVAIHLGAVRAARRLKSEIPEFDEVGTAIEDEFEFEF